MLNFAVYNQIKQRLLGLSQLTKELTVAPGSFFAASVVYLTEFQGFSESQRLYITSDITTALNKILAYEEIGKSAAGSVRRNHRKEKDAFAVNCIDEFHRVVKNFLEKDNNRFDECENIWRQVLARAVMKGYESTMSSAANKLDVIIGITRSDNELLPYYSHIIGLVGIVNAKAVLDTVLPQLNL